MPVQRRYAVALFVSFTVAVLGTVVPLRGQCPNRLGGISNFRQTAYTGTSWTLAWDPPAGAPPGTVYEILKETGSGYCSLGPLIPFTTTTATSYTADLSTLNIEYGFFVRLKSDPCTTTEFTFVVDTFTTPPAKPPNPTVTAGANSVTLTFPYSDQHTFEVDVFRAPGSGGTFSFAGSARTCTGVGPAPDPKTFTDPNLAPGTYRYILSVDNYATFLSNQSVLSDVITVTVGPPRIISFAATPPTIRAGQPATLSWNVDGATSVLIDQGVGTQPLSGTVTVTPSTTTTYTLTAMSGLGSSTATVTVNVITTPIVVVSSFPTAMLQQQGVGGATTNFTLTNAGGSATTVTLSQSGNFFTQTPASFSLSPGGSQVVTITASAQSSGAFEGTSIPSGSGVAAGLQIPVKLLSTAPPAGTVSAKPTTNRVDVAAAAGASPTGTISFKNSGNTTLTGVLVSDVPWLIPQSGIVTIPAGDTASFTFTIDRSKRTDADALAGSAAANVSLVYLSGSAGKIGALETTPAPSVSLVSVVDTVQLSVASAAPPPLAAGEIALFVPGVGHITGSVGTFISDVSVLNPPGNPLVNDVRFFYTGINAPAGSQKSTSLPVVGNASVAFADVVKNVFGNDAQVGSLQIRSASADKLSVSTNIFNSSNPAGTYGTAIPTFRSDRSVGPGGRLVLTGIRQDPGAHTNFFIQETAGVGVTVQTEFIDQNGSTVGTRSDTVGPFALTQINSAAPPGTVAAFFTNTSSGSAKFLAYATPVDNASGDNWSVVDWSRQFGYLGSDPIVIPVAGVLQGANNTFFRTDVTITNTGGSQGSGALQFFPRSGSPSSQQITLGARQSMVLNDVIGTFFNAPSGSVGFLMFTPSAGTFAITNRTYTTVAGQTGTFGSASPALPVSGSLKTGSLRAIGSLEDATRATIIAARPATFRTNFGMLETSGNSATVRVTLRFNYPAGTKLQAVGSAFKDYTLAPNQFMQLNGIATEILGPNRDTLGDLRGLEADFQVISGNGAVAVFTSSIDNGTGDSILRTE